MSIAARETMLSCRFDPLDAGERLRSGALATIEYGERFAPPEVRDGQLVVRLHMAAQGDGFAETWSAEAPVRTGIENGLVYVEDGEHMMCAGHVPAGGAYAESVRERYLAAFGLLNRRGYRHLLRMWNALAGINERSPSGIETYRDFCCGRAQAFDACGATSADMPAATGVGAVSGGLGFHLLASRFARRVNIENPRQIPAYRYPARYGPRSPSFARATWAALPGDSSRGGRIYVAGTASIIGHETMHPGDVEAQCMTSLANIACLLDPAHLALHGIERTEGLRALRHVKVYVRHADDMPVVHAICSDVLPETDLRLINVDICRKDLLVEIEGVVAEEPS